MRKYISISKDNNQEKTKRSLEEASVVLGVGSKRLALAVASQSLADVRAIARAKPKAARIAGGKPCGRGVLWGWVVGRWSLFFFFSWF